MRSDAEIISQGQEVQTAPTTAAAERLAKRHGVKGVPILSFLKSLSFPRSFPFNFMHPIWENLIKNLGLLWTGEFKGLDKGTGEYQLAKAIWEAIAKRTSEAADTIPSAYGSRVPNIAKDRPNVSAEMWSFWTLYLGPVLLQRKFRSAKYYDHFIVLLRLLNICLQFETTDGEIETVRVGFIDWVQRYEDAIGPSLWSDTAEVSNPVFDVVAFPGPQWTGHVSTVNFNSKMAPSASKEVQDYKRMNERIIKFTWKRHHVQMLLAKLPVTFSGPSLEVPLEITLLLWLLFN
ncbi:hypothetical protein C8R43DRAFT_961259 [Mycena crocata]|nr:hypothetical protein C8R43DRAFT_961259 [Mycena crocata]